MPQRAQRQVGALDHPRGGDAEHEAGDGAADDQAQGVGEQLADPRPDQQVPRLVGSDGHRVNDHEAERTRASAATRPPASSRQQGLQGRPVRPALRALERLLEGGHAGAQRSPASCIMSITASLLRVETSICGGWSSSKGLTGGSRETSGQWVLQRVRVGDVLPPLSAGEEVDEPLGVLPLFAGGEHAGARDAEEGAGVPIAEEVQLRGVAVLAGFLLVSVPVVVVDDPA